MTVRAKFSVVSKIANGVSHVDGGTSLVTLTTVYSDDPASENKAFTESTPSGQISITIADNKPALEQFVVGGEYYVDFTKVIA